MQRHGFPLLAALCAALVLASCAGAPKAPAAPEKIRKEREVVVKTPVTAKETAFYADGLVDEYSIYKYDAENRLLLEKAVYDAARPEPVERYSYEYAAGRLAAELSYDAEGKPRQRREYAYDASGRLASERVLDAKGLPLSSSAYAYDAAGRRVEWRALDGSGLLRALTAYAYEGDRLVLVEMKDAASRRTGSIRLEYGPAGLPARKSYLAADGSLQKYEAMAYEGGRLASLELRRADGSLASRSAYAYGPLGELLSRSDFDGSGALKARLAVEYLVREDRKTEVYYE